MTRAFSETEFTAKLNGDQVWRMKEISDLKTAVLRADSQLERTLLRSLVAICYAHWEGRVKFSASQYLEFVAIRRLRFDQLHRQFYVNFFLNRLSSSYLSSKSLTERCKIVELILTSQSERFGSVDAALVSTKSNLNFDVLYDICTICSLDISKRSDYASFIDIMLLKRRNAIAHGEETFIDKSDLNNICDQTIAIMRLFGNLLENNIVLGEYKAM